VAKAPDDLTFGAGTRTARSKFLDSVKSAAEASHLELLVEPEGPNSGRGYIQKKDSFSNYYSFHFEFGDTSAVFYLGADSTESADAGRREVEYSRGTEMEAVLKEVRQKISSAAEEAYPHLRSLAEKRPIPPANPEALAAMRRIPSQSENDAFVWGQNAATLDKTRYRNTRPYRRSRATAVATVVVLLVLVFTLAPVIQSHGSMAACKAASCKTSTTYFQSASFRLLGVGVLYLSHGVWGSGTVQAGNGTTRSGLGMGSFYVVW